MIYWNRDYYRYGIVYSFNRFLHLRNGENVSTSYVHPVGVGDFILENDEVLIGDMTSIFDGLYFYFDSSNANVFEYDTYYYADDGTWKSLILTLDETNNWTQDGKIEFDIPSDWVRYYFSSSIGNGFVIKFVFKNVVVQSSVLLSSDRIHFRNLINILKYTDANRTIEEIYEDSQNSVDVEVNDNFKKNNNVYSIDYGLMILNSSSYGYLDFNNCLINFGSLKKPGGLHAIGGLYLKTDKCIINIDIPGYQYNFSPNYLSEIKNTRIFINQKSAGQRLAIIGSIIGVQKTLFKNFEWNYGYLSGTYKIVDSVVNPQYFFTNLNCEYENLTIISTASLDPSYAIYENIKFDTDGMWLSRYTPNDASRPHILDIINCSFPNDNDYNIRTSSTTSPLSSTNTIWKHGVDLIVRTNTFQPIQGIKLSIKDVNGFDSIFLEVDILLSGNYTNVDEELSFTSDISSTFFVDDILLIQGELVKILSIINNTTIQVERGRYWSIPHYFMYSSNKIFKQVEFLYSNENGEFDENIKLIYHTRCTGTDLGGIFRDKEEQLSPFTIRLEKEGYVTQENIIETIPNMKIYNQMTVDISQDVIIINAENKLLTNRLEGGIENA